MLTLLRIIEGSKINLPKHPGTINWHYFIECVRHHGVSGLLWKSISRDLFQMSFPEYVRDWLRDSYYAIAATNTLMLESLEEIQKEFQSRGIDFLTVKGSILLNDIYDDIGTRPMNDIDILVKPEELHIANSVLLEIGYGNEDYSPKEYSRGAVALEVHTRLEELVTPVRLKMEFVPSTISDKKIWLNRIDNKLLGFPLSTPSMEDMLALTVLHTAFKHEFERFIWIIDFVRLIRKHVREKGWRAILKIAGDTGIHVLMNDLLKYAQMALGLQVPSHVYRKLSNMGNSLLQRELLSAVFKGRLDGLSRHAYSLVRTRTLRGKAAFLLRAFTPSKRVLAQQSGVRHTGLLSYLKHCGLISKQALKFTAAIIGIK